MKKNNVWGPFLRFYTKFQIPWHFYLISALLGMLSAELMIKIAEITIQVNNGELKNSVIISYALFSVGSGIVMGLQAVAAAYGEKTVTMRAQSMLWKKILRLPQKTIDREQPAELISCITNDVTQASTALSMIFLAVSSLYAFGRACIVFARYNSAMAFYMLPAVPVAAALFFIVGRLEYRSLSKRYAALNLMTAWFSEHLAAAKYVKVQGLEEEERLTGYQAIESRYQADIYYTFASQFQVMLNSLYTNLSSVILALGGSSLIRKGQMPQNGISASSAYMDNINRYLAELLTDYQTAKGTQGSLLHVSHLLDETEESLLSGKTPSPEPAAITFQNVTFGYDPMHPILKNVSFTIPANQKTAIVGENGCGKSTILKLIQGFYQTDSGTIAIGGVPLKDLKLHSLRRQFAYVIQNTPLFSGTIQDNITYGLEQPACKEDIISAAKQAGIHDFILSLPQGYDTPVGEQGTNLSGGQRQRIAIARALMVKPLYLILDEATASLDYQTAGRVMRLVTDSAQTVIYISHNPAEALQADYMIVMSNGAVEACGTPEEMKQRGTTFCSFAKTRGKEIRP